MVAGDHMNTSAMVRVLVLAILIFSMIGTGAELALLGHYEDFWQWAPIVLLFFGFVATVWNAASPSRAGRRTLFAVMSLFVVAGLVGLGLHFNGNLEFEREMYPSLAGWPLIWKALRGATPALAPGTMVYIGLLGLLAWYISPSQTSTPS